MFLLCSTETHQIPIATLSLNSKSNSRGELSPTQKFHLYKATCQNLWYSPIKIFQRNWSRKFAQIKINNQISFKMLIVQQARPRFHQIPTKLLAKKKIKIFYVHFALRKLSWILFGRYSRNIQRQKTFVEIFMLCQVIKNAKLEFTKASGIINCDYDQTMKNEQEISLKDNSGGITSVICIICMQTCRKD